MLWKKKVGKDLTPALLADAKSWITSSTASIAYISLNYSDPLSKTNLNQDHRHGSHGCKQNLGTSRGIRFTTCWWGPSLHAACTSSIYLLPMSTIPTIYSHSFIHCDASLASSTKFQWCANRQKHRQATYFGLRGHVKKLFKPSKM